MYLLRFSSLSLHDEENDGDGATANGRRDCALCSMRVARRDHMITWSQAFLARPTRGLQIYLGAGFCPPL